MVQQPNIHQRQGFAQALRDAAVCITGLTDSGGVIVGQNQGSRIVLQGPFDHFPWMDTGSVNGAAAGTPAVFPGLVLP